MNSAQAKHFLDRFLTSVVETFGFTRAAALNYTSSLNEATATISFSFRWDARGFAAFSCGVGVRIGVLAHWLNDGANDKAPTLGTPLHFLRKDRSFTEWNFTGPDDLETLRQSIIADLTNHAMPFIEKYSHLDEVVKTVASPNAKDWFNWNANSRMNLLAVARIVQGDRVGAIKLLDDALVERKKALPKERFEIEWLQKRLRNG